MGTEVAHKLLDFSQDLDVSLLDATVTRFYAGSNEEVRATARSRRPLPALCRAGPYAQAVFRGKTSRAWRHDCICLHHPFPPSLPECASQQRGHSWRGCSWLLVRSPCCRCKAAMQRIASEGVLRELQKHPEAWTRVDRILELSQSQQAKFIALQVRHAAALPGLLFAVCACAACAQLTLT